MKKLRQALGKTDWQLLMHQKLTVRALIQTEDATAWADEHLQGLLHWIDAVQDAAEEEGFPVVWEPGRMKVYVGISDGMGGTVMVNDGGVIRPLNPRFDLANHSPDGFSWGYHGSGPSQLALAILADYFGSKERGDEAGQRAIALYHDFKDAFVAKWSQKNNFAFTSAEIDNWLAEVKPSVRVLDRDEDGFSAVEP